MEKKVTFKDIAKYSGYSKMTVSRYFNSPEALADETKIKIESALKALNYKSNKVAKILANGKSEFIGIIVPELFLDYYSKLLNEILTTYHKSHYKFIVFAGNHDKILEKKYIDELLSYQVEGLIIISYTLSSYDLSQYNIPIVSIEREDEHISSVNTNNYLGGEIATKCLIDNKCDIFIHINGFPKENVPSFDRIRAFENICKKNNLNYEIIKRNFINDHEKVYDTLDEVYKYIEEKYHNKKIGIFCSNDNLALYFVNILKKYERLIPEEFVIIGFDNTVSNYGIVPITTISQNIKKIAENTIDILSEQIKQKNANLELSIKKVLVEPTLILRNTTKNT